MVALERESWSFAIKLDHHLQSQGSIKSSHQLPIKRMCLEPKPLLSYLQISSLKNIDLGSILAKAREKKNKQQSQGKPQTFSVKALFTRKYNIQKNYAHPPLIEQGDNPHQNEGEEPPHPNRVEAVMKIWYKLCLLSKF